MSIERVTRSRSYPILHHEEWDIVVCDNCLSKLSDDPERWPTGTVLVPGKAEDAHYCAECAAKACPRCRSKGVWNFDEGRICDACLEADDREGAAS